MAFRAINPVAKGTPPSQAIEVYFYQNYSRLTRLAGEVLSINKDTHVEFLFDSKTRRVRIQRCSSDKESARSVRPFSSNKSGIPSSWAISSTGLRSQFGFMNFKIQLKAHKHGQKSYLEGVIPLEKEETLTIKENHNGKHQAEVQGLV